MTAVDGPDDRELLRAHLTGDPEAFGELFARHRDRLWAVALRTTGDPEEAADALQDGMVSAFRRADSYRGDAAVTTWLHRIVVNACLDRLRRRKVRAAEVLPDDLDDLSGRGSLATSTLARPGGGVAGSTGGAADDSTGPVAAVLGDEQRRAVLAALAQLPAGQRAALVLVDMEGFSVDEAADVLGCAVGTVKSRCSRGRTRLAPLLNDLWSSGGNREEPARVEPGTPPTPTRGGEVR